MSANSSGTARMTVEDAARVLGIQTASVRKRIKRGKLVSEDADGKTFVFLDVDKLVQDGSNARRSRPAAEQSKVSLENLGAISAVVAAFAAGIYVLGLVVLWAPVARTASHDLTTAWHAASLVPRTVVAGYGLVPLMFPAGFSLLLLVWLCLRNGAAFVINKHLSGNKSVAKAIKYLSDIKWSVTPLYLVLVALLITFRSEFVNVVVSISKRIHSLVWFLPPNVVSFVVVFLFFWLTPLLISAHARFFASTTSAVDVDGQHHLPRVSNWGQFSREFAIYFAVMFVPAFLWALIVAKPRLSPVEVTTKDKITESIDKTYNGKPTFDARLLAHTDSFWYVFEENGGTLGELVSIHDDRVYRMRTPQD